LPLAAWSSSADRCRRTASEDQDNLSLRNLKTGAERRLTHSTGSINEIGYASVFSPDGKEVAYSWVEWGEERTRGQLRISGVNDNSGKDGRIVASNDGYIGPLGWSPDGRWLAVTLVRNDRLQLALVSVTNGSIQVLDDLKTSRRKAFFSPDSRYLAISLLTGAGAEHDVGLYPVDKSPRIGLVTTPEDNHVMGWANDGRLLYTRGGAVTRLWAVNVVNGKAQGTPVMLQEGVGTDSLGLTSSGALYYGVSTGGFELYVAGIDFASTKMLTPAASPLVSGGTAPSWSPDGKSLAYASDGNLFIRAADTGQTRMFRGGGGEWSADSRSLLRVGRSSSKATNVIRVDAETGAETTMVQSDRGPDELIEAAVLSRDGRLVYYRKVIAGAARSAAIVEHDIASGRERELLRRDLLAGMMLSPDGRYLAVGGRDASMLIPLNGEPPRELLSRPGSGVMVAMWAPDSTSVYVWQRQAKQMLRVGLKGEPPVPVDFDVDLEQVGGMRIAVHPNGRQVAYAVNAGPRVKELWVLDHFLPAVK
jgi:Tol biopolymer transport system component